MSHLKELLLEDLKHFGDAFLRNEEIGEKRLAFTMTLMTALGGGLVALVSTESFTRPELDILVACVLLLMIIFSFVGYLRMLQRNRVAEEYKKTLKQIRATYVSTYGEGVPYAVPWKPDRKELPIRGGYADSYAVLVCLLLIVTFSLYGPWTAPVNLWVAMPAGILVAVWLLWRAKFDRERHGTSGDGGPEEYFRAGVGAVILNREGKVLTLKRKDVSEDAWQFPQGGIGRNEDPLDAVLREIQEETGIGKNDLELEAKWPELLAYELPKKLRRRKTGRGQVQYWFVFRITSEARLKLPTEEFEESEWRTMTDTLGIVKAFRKPVYEALSRDLERIIGDVGVGVL